MALRVLHVVDSLKPDAGSVAISLRGLIPALRDRGVESEAIAPDGHWPSTVADARATDAVTASVQSSDAALLLDLDRIDLVHLHGWGYEPARVVAKAARQAGKPYVLSPHGVLAGGGRAAAGWLDRLGTFWRERGLVSHAAAVAALNDYEMSRLADVAVHRDLRLLPYGIVCSEYGGPVDRAGSPAPGEGRCLLMLGPIEPASGCVALLKAFGELGPGADDWNVVLAGRETGDWRRMLEAAVRRKGGEGRVTFGSAPDLAGQRAWLARAAVVAAPSLHVRFEASILQAVAAGLLVVASTCVAPAGLDAAMRTCAPNRDALRKTLRAVLELSDEERAQSAAEARTLGRRVFDWSVLVDRYVELYKSLI